MERESKIFIPETKLNKHIDFETLVKEYEDLIRQVDNVQTIDSEQISDILENELNEPETVNQLYDQVIARLQRETSLFQEAEEMGLMDLVSSGFNKEKKKEVEKLHNIKIKKRRIKKVHHYDFFYQGRNIKTPYGGFSSKREIILELLREGTFYDLDGLVHEVIHSQHSLGKHELPDEVAESLAVFPQKEGFIGNMIDKKKEKYRSIPFLIERIEKYYGKANVDNVIFSIRAVKHLLAIGMGYKEISHLFGDKLGEWDTKTGTYPEIQNIINDTMKQNNVNEYDLDNIASARAIKHKMSHLKAKVITAEEILKLKE